MTLQKDKWLVVFKALNQLFKFRGSHPSDEFFQAHKEVLEMLKTLEDEEEERECKHMHTYTYLDGREECMACKKAIKPGLT